ncbi:hypothetical protein COO60DRAFT_417441 [Scenedesmus sp. NREL 46B-D3]|nr:hypothetical protein COO60DRAFT_417441 [Scenedesmus sp. NREL 46B-D3]
MASPWLACSLGLAVPGVAQARLLTVQQGCGTGFFTNAWRSYQHTLVDQRCIVSVSCSLGQYWSSLGVGVYHIDLHWSHKEQSYEAFLTSGCMGNSTVPPIVCGYCKRLLVQTTCWLLVKHNLIITLHYITCST